MATFRTSWAGGGTTGSTDRTVSVTAPTVGDLLVVVCAASGNTNAAPVCSDDQGGTYQLIGTALKNTSADILSVFVRKQAFANTSTHTVTVATGANTAAEIVAVAYSGMTFFGIDAVRSSGFQANQAASGTPAPALNIAALTGNPTITGCFNATVAGSVVVPNASWTERQDVAQSTPTTGLEVATRDSGFTGTSITAGGTSATAFASFAVELDSTTAPPVRPSVMSRMGVVAVVGLLALGAGTPANVALRAPTPFTNVVQSTVDAKLVRQVTVDGSRRSRAIYDAVPSTDQLRGPVQINRRQVPPQLYPAIDTSQRQPLTLLAAQPAPFVPAPHLGPVRGYWQPADTTADTPKALTFDAQSPVGSAQFYTAPDRQRPVTNTTAPWLKTLYGDSQAPVGARQVYTQPDRLRPVSDTSADTPKALIPDAQAPVGAQTQSAPAGQRATLPDTSQRSLVVLADVQPPLVQPPSLLVVDWRRIGRDTSLGTPKTLSADAQAPVGTQQTFTAPDRPRPVTDTTADTPKPLVPDAQRPVGGRTDPAAPSQIAISADTSQNAAALVRTATAPAPAVSSPFLLVADWRELGADTTCGTPKPLLPDAQAPVGAAQTFTPPDALRPVTSTTSGSAPAVLDDPGVPVVVPPEPPGGAQWRPANYYKQAVLREYHYESAGLLRPTGDAAVTRGRVEHSVGHLFPTMSTRVSVGRISSAEASLLPRGLSSVAVGRGFVSSGRCAPRGEALALRGRAFRAAGELRPYGAAAAGRHFVSAGCLTARGAAKVRFVDARRVRGSDEHDRQVLQALIDDQEDSNG